MTNTLRAVAAAAILICLLALGAAARLSEPLPAATSDETPAKVAAEAWLAHVDAERYGESWETAATLFRSAVTKAQWQQQLGAARGPLGKLQSRRLTQSQATSSLPGAPQGRYVMLQWQASYEHKPESVETVATLQEQDGQWRVAGYFIR